MYSQQHKRIRLCHRQCWCTVWVEEWHTCLYFCMWSLHDICRSHWMRDRSHDRNNDVHYRIVDTIWNVSENCIIEMLQTLTEYHHFVNIVTLLKLFIKQNTIIDAPSIDGMSACEVTEFSLLEIDSSTYTTPGNPSTTNYMWTYGGSTDSYGHILHRSSIRRSCGISLQAPSAKLCLVSPS